jgi:hypothetical protein
MPPETSGRSDDGNLSQLVSRIKTALVFHRRGRFVFARLKTFAPAFGFSPRRRIEEDSSPKASFRYDDFSRVGKQERLLSGGEDSSPLIPYNQEPRSTYWLPKNVAEYTDTRTFHISAGAPLLFRV